VHPANRAQEILSDIDRRFVISILQFTEHHLTLPKSIAIVTLFAGLQRFPRGRGFKQWTGDDSKALMKVRNGALAILYIDSYSQGIYSGD